MATFTFSIFFNFEDKLFGYTGCFFANRDDKAKTCQSNLYKALFPIKMKKTNIKGYCGNLALTKGVQLVDCNYHLLPPYTGIQGMKPVFYSAPFLESIFKGDSIPYPANEKTRCMPMIKLAARHCIFN